MIAKVSVSCPQIILNHCLWSKMCTFLKQIMCWWLIMSPKIEKAVSNSTITKRENQFSLSIGIAFFQVVNAIVICYFGECTGFNR